LQEATNQRREEEKLEEQAELEAAMREKEQRSMSTSPGQGSPLGLQIGTEPLMRRVKILLLGDSNVGKTSIIARLTTGDFKTKMVQTVGVDYKPKKVNINGENIQVRHPSFPPSPHLLPTLKVQLWDTAGSEKFRQITTSYYRGVNGIMLCFDVSQRETYERVADWLQNIKKHATENVHLMLVGNKIDLRHERGDDPNCVHEREVRPIANKYATSIRIFIPLSNSSSHPYLFHPPLSLSLS
jgi:small GTP-binding protein